MKDLMNFRTIAYVAFISIVAVMLYNKYMAKPTASTAMTNGNPPVSEETAGRRRY